MTHRLHLTASVECGKYIQADRGILTLADDKLQFETGGRCLFDVPLSTIQKIAWPWYSFNGTFEATIADQRYFLSFVPRGAGLDEWYRGLSTGRQWRVAMAGRPAPKGAPIPTRLFRVFFRIAQVFLLGCSALLSLSVAIDPAASTLSRILGGAGAAALALLTLVLASQGMMAIVATLRSKH